MVGYPLEIILSRQFADALGIAIFLTDPEGNLLFYNEPAEQVLGLRFEDTGPMPVEEWSVVFNPTDADGNQLAPLHLPLVQTITNRKPATGDFFIESMQGSRFHLEVHSYPMISRTGDYLGAMAIFWERDKLWK